MQLILSSLIVLIAFYVMAILTEEFFVPAIDKLATKLKLSSDAAGATLLAIGSSAPEFFTSFFAILGIVGSGNEDIGAGTIVGSAIFNILVIIGASAMFKSVTVQWKPVLRDLAFYIVTILMLLAVFADGKIVLLEAISFVVMYIIYVFAVVNWRKWFKYNEVPAPDIAEELNHKGIHKLTYNLIGLFVPSPTKHPKKFQATFVLSILAIAGISWVLVDQVILIADIAGINPTFLALTVLAAGTSIPDLIGSIVVAKQGRGDMAVGNAIGSNIFDVLFCLGFPWLLVLSFKSDSIEVGTANLGASVILLFATVVATLFLLIIRNWRIGHKSGLILISLYVAYCIYIALTVA